MKKTFEQKMISKFKKCIEKYPWMKIPCVIGLVVVVGGYKFGEYFASNGKRFVALGVLALFFMINSSFSFPGFSTASLSVQTEDGNTYNSQVELADESDMMVSLDDVELLDDEDVLDGYEDVELQNVDSVDKYTLDEILEGHAHYADTTDNATDSESEVVFDKNDWRLLLINKQHPIPDDYTFTLGTIKGSMKCDERIIGDLLAMFQAAKEDGINLAVCSPYRDISRQEMLFNRKITAYMAKGMSYMEAYSLASQAVTVPGASEHQVGLALDIVSDTYTTLDEGFEDTEAGKWLAQHSCEYGFILRYPKGKEYITGIQYEPWHFRYVGKDAATVITERGICLEEFIEDL